jgi:hypothetical protein
MIARMTRTLPYLALLAIAAPAAADELSLEAIDRPVVLPSGMAGFATNVDVQKPAGNAADVTTMALGGGFGVTDRLELGANYRFAFDAFELRGPLTVYGGALIAHGERYSIGAGADFVADFAAPAVVNGMTTTATTETIHLGIGARANLSPIVAVYTGNMLAPNPVGQQLAIGIDHDAPVAFDVPAGLAIQASPRVLLRLETVAARLGIAHARDQVAFADATPLTVNLLLAASRGLDFATFFTDPDMRAFGDRFTLGFVARWYAN